MFEIIDFHTHPYIRSDENICIYKGYVGMDSESIEKDLGSIGISAYCGSVIGRGYSGFENIRKSNDMALEIKSKSRMTYIPGIQIHPAYRDESAHEIDRATENGIKMAGELVPAFYKYEYSHPAFEDLLDHAKGKIELFSLHTMNLEVLSEIPARHKDIDFVFAHPGEKAILDQHIQIMKKNDNVYLDISGTGLFRYGMLKQLVDEVGAERILFGTDYPICNPNMYIAGVLFEKISDREKELIFAGNAKRLLRL